MPLTKVSATMIGDGTGQAFNPGVPVYENSNIIATNYSVSTGSNAMSAGPITISDGVAVTIPDGSVWTIV